jgi:hypothetical protein
VPSGQICRDEKCLSRIRPPLTLPGPGPVVVVQHPPFFDGIGWE